MRKSLCPIVLKCRSQKQQDGCRSRNNTSLDNQGEQEHSPLPTRFRLRCQWLMDDRNHGVISGRVFDEQGSKDVHSRIISASSGCLSNTEVSSPSSPKGGAECFVNRYVSPCSADSSPTSANYVYHPGSAFL